MDPKQRLLDGFRQFKQESYAGQVEAYRRLAAGQRPRSMIVACSDSRVDPSTIFSAGPGELFVVRNVANLVPPFADDRLYHGTSAALEFAVDTYPEATIVALHVIDPGEFPSGGFEGSTDLLIAPGYAFARVDGLLTNFHLPRSTLLALVMAFAGVEETRRLYRIAIDERYRFYSFGDAMLVL